MKTIALPFLAAGFVAIACSSTPETSGCPEEDPFCDPTSSSSGGSSGTSSGGFADGGTTINGCTGSELSGKAQPVHMILALDTSGSMCNDITGNGQLPGGGNRTCQSADSRWQLTVGALASFFKNANSASVFASVIPWADESNNCSNLKPYDAPLSPADEPLPNSSDSLASSIRALQPKGATPTKAALEGALRHANALKGRLTDGGRVVIALVTDGEPTCGTSNDAKAAAATAKAAGVPVYVIGIGTSEVSMNSIAEGGGTNSGKAFFIKNNIDAEMAAALADIKGSALGCATKLPAAPQGERVDLAKVNVKLTVKGSEKVVPQSQDCSNASGWRYIPDATNPTGIELCTGACAEVSASLVDAKLNIVLGCTTVSR
jgi:hypothetical protein